VPVALGSPELRQSRPAPMTPAARGSARDRLPTAATHCRPSPRLGPGSCSFTSGAPHCSEAGNALRRSSRARSATSP